jgi:hypothetical protein
MILCRDRETIEFVIVGSAKWARILIMQSILIKIRCGPKTFVVQSEY